MKKTLYIFLTVMLLFSMTVPVFANSAEPPAIIIISTDLPREAVLTLEVPVSGEVDFRRCYRVDKLWESQYKLWLPFDLDSLDNAQLRITVGEESFTCQLPVTAHTHRSVFTLNYREKSLTEGQLGWRQPLLTAIRILLTLLTEGLVFLLFGFKKKRSWGVFIVLNLLTQGWLNIVINSYAFNSGYWVFNFLLIELAIFLIETVTVPLAVREGKLWKRILCPLTANAFSLGLGILLIGHMPL